MKSGYFYCYDMIFDLNISTCAKLVYAYLCRCSDKRGRCYPSMENIGDACGLKSRTTVNKALNELQQAGLLEKENRRRLDGSNSTNIYIVYEKPHE